MKTLYVQIHSAMYALGKYVFDIIQHVHFGLNISSSVILNSGAPQGFVLGPPVWI